MFNKNLQFSITFLIIFILLLITDFNQDLSKIILGDFFYLIKPSITISLMIYLIFTSKLKGRFSISIFIGLLFGLAGDCFLMFVKDYPNFFIFGLISFLFCHVFYITAFYLDYKLNPIIEKKATRLALIIFGLYCLVFYFYLRPYLGQMRIPVMIYAFVISLMAIMAVNRKGRVGNLSYQFIFYGAILFLISDSILAYNKFVNPFKYSGLAIMSTYMLAQYLIVIGAVMRKKKKTSSMRLNSN